MIPVSRRLARRYQNPIIPEPVRTWLETCTYDAPGAALESWGAFHSFRAWLPAAERRKWNVKRLLDACRGVPIGLWRGEPCFANRALFPPRFTPRDDYGPLILSRGRLWTHPRQLRDTLRAPARVVWGEP